MRGRLMRTALIRILATVVGCLLLVSPVFAQAAQSKLVAVAALPASTLADGPQAGQKLGSKVINGLKVPFASQPVGNIVAIVPGDYANSWLVLSDSTFDNVQ